MVRGWLLLVLLLVPFVAAVDPITGRAPVDMSEKLEETQQFCLEKSEEARETAIREVEAAQERIIGRVESEFRQFKLAAAITLLSAVYVGFTLADMMRYRREKRRLQARIIAEDARPSTHASAAANPGVRISGKWFFLGGIVFFVGGLVFWGLVLLGYA